jgi:cell division protein FtsI (penicillin-binding protein 3)
VDVPSVYANPRHVKGRERATAWQLARVLDADPYLVEERLRTNRYFVWVQRRVSPEQARRVQHLRLKGVYFTKETRRFYPNGRLAGQLLGFAGVDGRGLEGVELYFDRWLRGSTSVVTGIKDAMGRAVFVEGMPDLGPSSGHTVVLTIDKNIQYKAELALEAAVKEYKAKGGTLVVMNPRNGEVLAMASAPGYDPNNHTASTPDCWRNRAVTDAFEPGSVTKVFTLAAALETRVARVNDHVYCENGKIEIDDHIIRDSHPNKWLTVRDCIKKSSNICTYKLAQRLGKRRLYTYLRQFGFGNKAGIELPGERKGRLRAWRRWSRVALANISFGQGFTTTAVQLAAAVSALANGGRLFAPRVVRSIRDADGGVTALYRPRSRRAISKSVAKRVVEIMKTVVEPGGTGVQAALDEYQVAGKTGTAQKVDRETGRYSKQHWVASFIGVVPADDPEVAIVVIIDEPQDKYYGGEVAAPVFKAVAETTLEILGVPKRRTRRRKKKNRDAELKKLKGQLGAYRQVAPPLPFPAPAGPKIQFPDFTGLSIHEVMQKAERAGLNCRLEGSGVAVNQSPPPGPAPADVECKVGFKPPP